MKSIFKKLVQSPIIIEIIETPSGDKLFGLKWGESKVATILGFKRKDTIKALDWADKNPIEAMDIIRA